MRDGLIVWGVSSVGRCRLPGNSTPCSLKSGDRSRLTGSSRWRLGRICRRWSCYAGLSGLSGSARVALPLFDDRTLTAIMDATGPTSAGYFLAGQVEGQPYSSVTLVVNGKIVIGAWRATAGAYTIQSGGKGDAHTIRESMPVAFRGRGTTDVIGRSKRPAPLPCACGRLRASAEPERDATARGDPPPRRRTEAASTCWCSTRLGCSGSALWRRWPRWLTTAYLRSTGSSPGAGSFRVSTW